MDKQQVIAQLDRISQDIDLVTRADVNSVVKGAAQFLEQTETVEEVREALERLENRTGYVMCYFKLFSSGHIVVAFHEDDEFGEAVCTHKAHNVSSVADIDALAAEPSSEPPYPSEVEPGDEVILKTGARAKLFPKTGQDEAPFLLVIEQSNGGWMASSLFPDQDLVDWQVWRKEKGL